MSTTNEIHMDGVQANTAVVARGCSPGCEAIGLYQRELERINKIAFENSYHFKRGMTLQFNEKVTQMEHAHKSELADLQRYTADKVGVLQREAAGRETQHNAAMKQMYEEQQNSLSVAERTIQGLSAMLAVQHRRHDGGSDGADVGHVKDGESDDGNEYFLD